MRHFVVLSLAVLMLAISATGVRADNQAAADRIAVSLSEQFPDCDITVQFQDGKVWLSGKVGSVSEIHKAIQFVSNLEGVEFVENEMTASKQTGVIAPASANMPKLMAEEVEETAPKVVKNTRPVRNSANSAPLPAVVTAVGETTTEQSISQVANRLQPIQSGAVEITTNDVEPSYIVSTPAPQVAGHHFTRQRALGMSEQRAVEYVSQGHAPTDIMVGHGGGGVAIGTRPNLPKYAWPSYAAHPNYAQVAYPKKYTAGTWPNIGPHYPYPEPPLGWRKSTLEWHDGHWWLDFDDGSSKGPFSPLFREPKRYTY